MADTSTKSLVEEMRIGAKVDALLKECGLQTNASTRKRIRDAIEDAKLDKSDKSDKKKVSDPRAFLQRLCDARFGEFGITRVEELVFGCVPPKNNEHAFESDEEICPEFEPFRLALTFSTQTRECLQLRIFIEYEQDHLPNKIVFSDAKWHASLSVADPYFVHEFNLHRAETRKKWICALAAFMDERYPANVLSYASDERIKCTKAAFETPSTTWDVIIVRKHPVPFSLS